MLGSAIKTTESLPQTEAARFSIKLVFSYKNTRWYGEEDGGLNFIAYITTDKHKKKKSSSIYS
jgi:hypothetical protein